MISTKKLLYRIINLLDTYHPVGCYFETSDTNFDPNVVWGGTWVLETAGQVHVSAGGSYAVSGALTNRTDGGKATHTLSISEIPSHNHGSSGAHTHALEIRTITGAVQSGSNYSRISSSGSNWETGVVRLSGGTSSGAHTHTSNGGGAAHNNMQPYIVVNRWHRTA